VAAEQWRTGGVNPKVIVLLAGTNDLTDQEEAGKNPVAGFSRRIQEILRVFERKAPQATIVLMAIFPRDDHPKLSPVIEKINANLFQMTDGRRIRYLNINDRLADRHGRLFDGMMNSRDQLHPTVRGYQVWAAAFKPFLTELLGPPANEDHAPLPTGDPAALR